MASKVINGSTANENISSRMVCSSKANTSGNYSLVSVSGRLSRTNTGYTTSGNGTFYLEINGKKYENSGYYEITYNSDTTVITVKDFKVQHNADGKKTIDVKFYGSMPDTTLTSISCSGKFTLDDIPRESAVSANVNDAKAGDQIKITLDRAVSSYTHDITFKLGNRTDSLTGVGESTTWTIPKDWQDQFPNAPNATLTITAITKAGSTSIGTTSDTVKVLPSADAAPDLTAEVEGVNLYWGLYIRSKSKAKITLTTSGKYGASISKRKISGGGFSGASNPYTTGFLLQDGEITFVCTVTDSRGLTSTVNLKINVLTYDPPQILAPEIHRTDDTGTEQINGNYIFVKATRGFSSCNGNNTASMVVQYREKSGFYGSSVPLEDGVAAILGDGEIAPNKFYDVKITISDEISSPVSQEFVIFTNKYRAVFGEDCAGICLYPPDGGYGLYTTDFNARGTIEAGGLITAKSGINMEGTLLINHANKPKILEINTASGLINELHQVYDMMEPATYKNIMIDLNATGAELSGGLWLVSVIKASDLYGCMFAYKYGSTKALLKANTLYNGTWLGWSSPAFE